MTIRDVLKSAFSWLFELEERMNTICDSLGEASPEEMEVLMEELGTIQDTLTMHDFYVIAHTRGKTRGTNLFCWCYIR